MRKTFFSLIKNVQTKRIKQTYVFDTRSLDLKEISNFLLKGQYRLALLNLRKLHKLDPNRKDVMLNLAIIKHYFGDLSAAEKIYKKILISKKTKLVEGYLEKSLKEQSLRRHYKVSL